MTATTSSLAGPLFALLLFGAFGVVAIVDTLRRARAARQRSLDLQGLAARLSFDDFNPGRDLEFATGWGFLSRLAQGQDRYAFNLLRGNYQEQALFVFDYHFQTGSGKQKQEHNCTFLMLVFKQIFPPVRIGPESLRTKVAETLGLSDDIQFESAEFSRRFCVYSPDKKFAYDVCNPQMMDYLLANPGLQLEIQGPVLLLAFEPQLPVNRIELNLQRLIEIRSRLPEYLFASS
jgi:hypothetical protein